MSSIHPTQFHNIFIITRVTAEVPWCASKKENLALALLELLVGEWAVPLRAFQVFQNIAALGRPCQKMVLGKQNFGAQGGEGVEDLFQLECGSLLVKIIPFEQHLFPVGASPNHFWKYYSALFLTICFNLGVYTNVRKYNNWIEATMGGK